MSALTHFQDIPFGAVIKESPKAAIAETDTTRSLVLDHEDDAFYFRLLEKNNIHLNRTQLEAVRHHHGPLLTIAGAGSGKTSVLISRAGYLLTVKKVKPENLLILTFSKKAAGEVKERINQIPGLSNQQGRRIVAGTFHSIFLRLIRSLGYEQKILSNEKHKQIIIKEILKRLGLQDSYQPETLLALISSYKVKIIRVKDLPAKTTIEKEVKDIYRLYEQWKIENHYMDFDDILYHAYQELTINPLLLKKLHHKFQYIMVDEFQDTNPISYELIKILAKGTNNIFVVGDPDQTIYTFNGSDISGILHFNKVFPDTRIITLDINYRSTTAIVGLGNEVIKHNINRHSKTLKAIKISTKAPQFIRPSTIDEEAQLIIRHIKEQIAAENRTFKDYAILYRTSSSSRAIFEQLVSEEIPFISYSEGDSFYETGSLRPIISYLRLALNRNDYNAIYEILPSLYLPREQTMEYIQKESVARPQVSMIDYLVDLPSLKPFQRKQIAERIQTIHLMESKSPYDAIVTIRKAYSKYLETDGRQSLTLNKEIINEYLDELEASAKRFKTIREFIDFIDIMIKKNKELRTSEIDIGMDAIQLMTIHKAKGLEFPFVYVIGVSDGILPHSSALEADHLGDIVTKEKGQEKINAAIEEERRLLYVAITRAKDEVYVSSPAHYRGKKLDVSRFLYHVFPMKKEFKIKRNNEETNHRKKEEVYAWLCSNPVCNIWQRITSIKESEQAQRICPVCNSPMLKGKHVIG